MPESTTKSQSGEESGNSSGMVKTIIKVVAVVIIASIIILLIYYGVQAYNKNKSGDDASGDDAEKGKKSTVSSGSRSELTEKGESYARDSAFNLINRKERA